MYALISIMVCVLLSFMYTLVNKGLLKFTRSHNSKRYTVLLWAMLVLIVGLVYPNSFLRKMSFDFFKNPGFFENLLTFGACAILLGCLSGYKTVSKEYDLHFCFTFPIFEEILFRGVILSILVNYAGFRNEHAVIISAALFGVMHFQYFGLKLEAVRFVLFAFLGGYYCGKIALDTQSILPTVFAHILFNSSAIILSRYRITKYSKSKGGTLGS